MKKWFTHVADYQLELLWCLREVLHGGLLTSRVAMLQHGIPQRTNQAANHSTHEHLPKDHQGSCGGWYQ